MTSAGDGTPEELLDRLILGFQHGCVLRAFVTLGLADALGAGPLSVEALAAATETHTPSLRRLLMSARAMGLVEGDAHELGLGAVGRHLTDGEGNRYRALVELYGPWLTRPWELFEETIRTGQPSFDAVHGTDFWNYVATHPDEAAAFNGGMEAGTASRAAAVTTAVTIESGTVVVDVGGGTGGLLAAILRQHPQATGILADTPEVVAGAGPVLAAEGVEDRVAIVPSSFFNEVPQGGDVYLLSRILHDWADEPAQAILRTTRAAMPSGSRLVIVEGVIPEADELEPDDLLDLAREDLEMLVLVGGRERTLREYRSMLEHAGFELEQMHASPGRDVIVATAAGALEKD